MRQASILGWVREKKPPQSVAYRFLMDIPEFVLPNLKTAGPFHKGDLVSKGALPDEVWKVLLMRGAVERFRIRPDYPAWKGG